MTVWVDIPFAGLALVSVGLTLWQWIEARRFPLHRSHRSPEWAPALALLKPLKGADAETESCLRSWFDQRYRGAVEWWFGVPTEDDPAVAVVHRLMREFPKADAHLVVCGERQGFNAKVSQLIRLQRESRHPLLVISDADVWAPPDLLEHLVAPLAEAAVGVVNPLYQLANPVSAAMRWEALAVNADFWTGVLQSRRLGPMKFALGAAMAVRRSDLEAFGGFAALKDHLADDFELGRRVVALGRRVEIPPVVVECREAPRGWRAIWLHQLRWSRTIRVCQPLPYAASLISNATFWPLLWLMVSPGPVAAMGFTAAVVLRCLTAFDNQRRLTRSSAHWPWIWLAPVKDLLQVALWALAFLGNGVEWRGEWYRVKPTGELVPRTWPPSKR